MQPLTVQDEEPIELIRDARVVRISCQDQPLQDLLRMEQRKEVQQMQELEEALLRVAEIHLPKRAELEHRRDESKQQVLSLSDLHQP